MPSPSGAGIASVLVGERWWGNPGAVPVLRVLPWGALSGCPVGWVSLPSRLAGHVPPSLGKQRWAFAARRAARAGGASAVSESLANTLEPLRWLAVPQTVLLHRRRGSHGNSVTRLCLRSPYAVCSFSSCAWIRVQLPLGTVPGRGPKGPQLGSL